MRLFLAQTYQNNNLKSPKRTGNNRFRLVTYDGNDRIHIKVLNNREIWNSIFETSAGLTLPLNGAATTNYGLHNIVNYFTSQVK